MKFSLKSSSYLSADLNAVICSLFVSCLFETTCKLVSGAGLKWPAAPSVLDEKIYCWSRWSVIATAAAAAEAAGQDAVIAMRSSAPRALSAGGGCYWVRALSRKSERETPSAPPPPTLAAWVFSPVVYTLRVTSNPHPGRQAVRGSVRDVTSSGRWRSLSLCRWHWTGRGCTRVPHSCPDTITNVICNRQQQRRHYPPSTIFLADSIIRASLSIITPNNKTDMYTRRVYDIKGHVCTRYRPLLRIVCLFSGHVFRDRFLRYLLACFYCLFFSLYRLLCHIHP